MEQQQDEQQKPSRTVMVVEDIDDTRLMVKRFLEINGYRVIEAVNGQQAVTLARRERPELILMDLNMPVLDGFTATLRIRESEQMHNIPVVAITAYDTAESRAAAAAVGCNGYLVKPIDLDRMCSLLEGLLIESKAPVGGEIVRWE